MAAFGYLKNGVRTGLTPQDSTTDTVVYSPSPAATQVEKCNGRCRGGDVMCFPERAIGHFTQRKKHGPFLLAFSLLIKIGVAESQAKGPVGC
jgi:hypothetical protein